MKRDSPPSAGFSSSQRGAILPLTAMVIGTVLFIASVVVSNSLVRREAVIELRRAVNSLCRNTAKNSITPEEALKYYAESVNALTEPDGDLLPHLTVTNAHLVIPTFNPATGDAIQGGGVPFHAVLVGSCGDTPCCNLATGDCLLHGSVSISDDGTYADPYLDNRFPPSANFWSNNFDQSLSIACELEAEVQPLFGINFDSLFGAVSTISARSVNTKTLTGYGGAAVSGITLVIAPQLTTYATDPRFRFNSQQFEYLTDFDPLHLYNWKADISLTTPEPYAGHSHPAAFLGTVHNNLWSGYGCSGGALSSCKFAVRRSRNMASMASDTVGQMIAARFMSGLGSDFFIHEWPKATGYQASEPLVLSQREERLVACMNPLVAARNLFTSSMVEAASRVGSLRSRTEILIANSMHRRSRAEIEGLPSERNLPVVAVRWGEDLTEKRYQLPYMTYESSSAGTAVNRPGYGPSIGVGDVSPISNSVNLLSDGLWEARAIIAGSLRDCYALYRGEYNGAGFKTGGIDRPVPDNYYSGSSQQGGMIGGGEDGGTYVLNKRVYGLAETFPDEKAKRDDQRCPWESNPDQVSSCPGGIEASSGGNRRLNASELVSIIGTAQSAPAEFSWSTDGVIPPWYIMRKLGWSGGHGTAGEIAAAGPGGELRPDLLAVLRYLSEREGDADSDLAQQSPGAFPTIAQFDQSKTLFNGDAESKNSHIVLVISQRISTEERDAISALFEDEDVSYLRNRPISLVYFPSNAVDASPMAITDLKAAFHIGLPVGDEPPDLLFRQLFIFSPYERSWLDFVPAIDDTYKFVEEYSREKDVNDFQNFWHELLTQDRLSPALAAREILLNNIFATGDKF